MARRTSTLANALRDAGTLEALRQLAGQLLVDFESATDPYDKVKLADAARLTMSKVAALEANQPPAPTASNAVDDLLAGRKRKLQLRAAPPARGSAS